MAQRLIAIGECMVELAPGTGEEYAIGFAGDTFNTAWYARQIAPKSSLDVSYFSAVGDDEISNRMTSFMQDAGIETCLPQIAGASVGLYMIFLKNGERSFQYWRSAAAARRLHEHLDQLPDISKDDVVYFSGISIAILPEHGRTTLLAKMKDCARQGARVVFDPNLRPRLWASPAEMTDWTMKAAACAEIVLPSFEDEATHFGDADLQATAQRYLQNGSEIAVVKNGDAPGLVSIKAGESFEFQTETVQNVVDTTAAGDSFNAAFLVDLMDRNDLRSAVTAGCSLASFVITQKGALAPVDKIQAFEAVPA